MYRIRVTSMVSRSDDEGMDMMQNTWVELLLIVGCD